MKQNASLLLVDTIFAPSTPPIIVVKQRTERECLSSSIKGLNILKVNTPEIQILDKKSQKKSVRSGRSRRVVCSDSSYGEPTAKSSVYRFT